MLSPNSDGIKVKHVMYYDPLILQNFTCIGTFCSFSFSFCTPQDCSECVSCAVDFRGGMLCTCLWNHFRDSIRRNRRYTWLFIKCHPAAWYFSELRGVLFTCTFYLHAIIRPYQLHYNYNIGLSVLCLFADISVDCNSYCNIHSCNKYYPTFFFDINTAVNSSAHGTHVLHLLRVGKEG